MKNILFVLLISSFSFAQEWNFLGYFDGDGRHHPITFSNDEYGFVASGSYLEDVYRYEKSNDTWVQLQDIPFSGRGYSYGVAVGDKAYMGFGSDPNSNCAPQTLVKLLPK